MISASEWKGWESIPRFLTISSFQLQLKMQISNSCKRFRIHSWSIPVSQRTSCNKSVLSILRLYNTYLSMLLFSFMWLVTKIPFAQYSPWLKSNVEDFFKLISIVLSGQFCTLLTPNWALFCRFYSDKTNGAFPKVNVINPIVWFNGLLQVGELL